METTNATATKRLEGLQEDSNNEIDVLRNQLADVICDLIHWESDISDNNKDEHIINLVSLRQTLHDLKGEVY
ncbi:hypothetical protein [Dysgonomonas reticulitermitis]